MVRNYFNYYTEVEEYFARKRGRNLLVSPLDWCLIELWQKSEIPLNVVLRGIDRSFESAAKRGKSEPRTLYYCHPAIQEAFKEYREAMVGGRPEGLGDEGPSGGPGRDEVLTILNDLKAHLASRQEEACGTALVRLAALIEEVSKGVSVNPEAVDRELLSIGSNLTSELSRSLDVETLASLEARVKEGLRVYRKRLSRESLEKIERSYLERILREHFGLPDFSLLEWSS